MWSALLLPEAAAPAGEAPPKAAPLLPAEKPMVHGLGLNSVLLVLMGFRAALRDWARTSPYQRLLTTVLAGWLFVLVVFLNTLALGMLPLTLWALRTMNPWLNPDPPPKPEPRVAARPDGGASAARARAPRAPRAREGEVTTLAGGQQTPGFVDAPQNPRRARFHSPPLAHASITLVYEIMLGAKMRDRISSSRSRARRHSPPLAQALRAAP